MKKFSLIAFLFLLVITINSDARLISGTTQHNHSSTVAGGSTLSGTTINNSTVNTSTINNATVNSSIINSPTMAGFFTIKQSGLSTAFRIQRDSLPSGGYFMANGDLSNPGIWITNGMSYNGTNWIAEDTNVGRISISSTNGFILSFDSGLTNGSSFTPTIKLIVKPDGTIISYKPCAAGYTRITPNFCKRNGGTVNVASATYSTSCLISTGLEGVTDAKAVLITASLAVFSGNALALRSNDLFFYNASDTGCSTLLDVAKAVTRESASCLDCVLSSYYSTHVLLTNTSGQYRYRVTNAPPVAAAQEHYIIGYFD